MEYVIISLLGIVTVLLLVMLFKKNDATTIEKLNDIQNQLKVSKEVNKEIIEQFNQQQNITNNLLDKRLIDLSTNLNVNQTNLNNATQDALSNIRKSFSESQLQNEQKLENIRTTVEYRLSKMQTENATKLDEMRGIVDEKLQKTLEERIGKSFSLVSERLEQVQKGLGEMSALASGVGDLKKVLTNVKTRGILGEIQLGAILEELLTKEQYETNVITKKGSKNFVEYAIKLPGDDLNAVLLPIDSKFPVEDYVRLNDAYESGNIEEIASYGKSLERSIKLFAKDIHDKYISVPETTDFGIMFLPVEGLYAEAVKRGLVEVLQKEYRISIAGPTTMAALLNSLQMGFRTLAIQKRSSEVWQVLAAVKSEFANFGKVLSDHQKKLDQANDELEKLVGVRTRKILSKLKNVDTIDHAESNRILQLENEIEVE